MAVHRTPSRPLPAVPAGADLRNERVWQQWLGVLFGVDTDRYRHSVAVWERCADLTGTPPAWLDPRDAGRLRLAGLLHDVGRGITTDDREPHALVGARFLVTAGLDDLAAIVAHHSGARFEAAARNCTIPTGWTNPDRDLLGVLTFLDHTTSRDGVTVSIAERRRELAERYGPGSIKAVTFDLAMADASLGRELVEGALV